MEPLYQELTVAAKVEELSTVNDFVARILTGSDCPAKTQMQIDLVVEEIFVNIASYAYEKDDGMAIVRGRLLESPSGLELIFKDSGRPYNPLARDDPNINLTMEERGIGGLGILLVKKNVNDIKYEYVAGENILTLRKNW